MAKRKASQEDMFPQKKIGSIERWADKVQEKRDLIAGLKDEQKNAEFKLAEALHANQAGCDVIEDPINGTTIVYKRGDYNVTVKRGKEKVNVKIGDASKPPATGEESEGSESADEPTEGGELNALGRA